VSGWFPLVNSEGIPLDVLLGQFQRRGLVPDWIDFVESCLRCDWNVGSLRTKIETAVGDVYGPEHRGEVMRRFDDYMRMRE